ncbi:alpha/beta hydrolase family protein [Paenibacillus alvei]|uniref:Acetylhydrolase n=1 Tax=Paenibacillus alvei TaxID=44250 RepID=A0A383RJ98_PAEAL|nr:acetylhydrolase [Paenibacillus alvei]SYX87107.1 Acetylhydrolase [Paenibacillus alvei]
MRSFELWSVVINLLLLGWLLFAKNKTNRLLYIGFGISAIFVLLHGLIEGMRWQMVPVYVITFLPICILAARYLFRSREVRGRKSKVQQILMIILAVLYSLITVSLPLLFPVFTFENPTGPYKIGTVTYNWKDERREETLTPRSGDKRELMVQIWYPASSSAKGKTAPYVPNPDVFVNAYSQTFDMPKIFFTSLKYVKTHAIENAEISDKEAAYPVLLFSHGMGGHKSHNTFQIEQLVSYGYIVVGIDHTYNSITSVFDDGRVANFIPQDVSVKHLDEVNKVWVEDAKIVLNQMEKLAQGDPDHRFTGRMDMKNVGMFGHSFGGATSVQMLLSDARIKAAINLDGGLFGQLRIPEGGVKKPLLMMSADRTLAGADKIAVVQGTARKALNKYIGDIFERYKRVAAGGNYWMKIKNMDHLAFCDLYLISPLLEKAERVNLRPAHRLINEYSLDFFNHYLKGKPFEKMEQHLGDNPEFSLERG